MTHSLRWTLGVDFVGKDSFINKMSFNNSCTFQVPFHKYFQDFPGQVTLATSGQH